MINQNTKLKSSVRNLAVKSGIVAAIVFGSGAVAISAFMLTPPTVNRLVVPSNLIALDSKIGQQLLAESRFKSDYTSLAQHFQTQKLRAYCGVASAVMIINALKSSAQPLSQDIFFTDRTQKVRSPYEVAFFGMNLAQLSDLLRSHKVNVEIQYASDATLEKFRTQVKENLNRDRDFVIVNYDRASVNQGKGGHISPISAYHEKSDRFLIADVSSYKYPPVWVSTSQLWNAINTQDRTTNRTRGYLLVRQ